MTPLRTSHAANILPALHLAICGQAITALDAKTGGKKLNHLDEYRPALAHLAIQFEFLLPRVMLGVEPL